LCHIALESLLLVRVHAGETGRGIGAPEGDHHTGRCLGCNILHAHHVLQDLGVFLGELGWLSRISVLITTGTAEMSTSRNYANHIQVKGGELRGHSGVKPLAHREHDHYGHDAYDYAQG